METDLSSLTPAMQNAVRAIDRQVWSPFPRQKSPAQRQALAASLERRTQQAHDFARTFVWSPYNRDLDNVEQALKDALALVADLRAAP